LSACLPNEPPSYAANEKIGDRVKAMEFEFLGSSVLDSRLLGVSVINLMLPGQEANQTRFCHPLR
jgi:hypothetical protein